MRVTTKRSLTAAVAVSLLAIGFVESSAAMPKKVRDYDGEVEFITDGGIPDGPCLRLSGRMKGDFFDGLRRIDDAQGTKFLRGQLRVTHFPEKVLLQFVIRDQLCPEELKSTAAGSPYLTPEIMRPLRLTFYWKRGLELRPARGVHELNSFAERVEPYDKDPAANLPERLAWNYEFLVPSAGVPLADHFVIILRAQEGRIVARVAARL